MAMKESVGSLQAYFILAAILGGTVNALALLGSTTSVGVILSATGLILSMALFYVGARLTQLLTKSPHQITAVLIAWMCYVGIGLLERVLLVGLGPDVYVYIIVALIFWYLFVNVKRLANAAKQVQPIAESPSIPFGRRVTSLILFCLAGPIVILGATGAIGYALQGHLSAGLGFFGFTVLGAVIFLAGILLRRSPSDTKTNE